MRDLNRIESDRLIVGYDTTDDAAVFKMTDKKAIIQSLDFFTPVVDDPYMYGQIAAANALSDIFAMGGKPTMALNIVGFPSCLDPEILHEILKGGADKVKEAGAILVGGHSIEDDEPKYGLSVTGEVEIDQIMSNDNAKVGDALVLTKPLGVGILLTALKADLLDESQIEAVTKNMSLLNNIASEGATTFDAHSITDVTGFGFLGHAYEMAKGSDVSFQINSEAINILPGAVENAEIGIIPAGAYENQAYIEEHVIFDASVETAIRDIMFDPQTSGGLLISIPKAQVEDLMSFYKKRLNTKATIIGEVTEKKDKYIYVG